MKLLLIRERKEKMKEIYRMTREEKSLDSLKALSSPHAKVLRDGKKMKIFSKEIVPGDIPVHWLHRDVRRC